MSPEPTGVKPRPLTEDEWKVIQRVRSLEYGSVEVVVHQGKPHEVKTLQRERTPLT